MSNKKFKDGTIVTIKHGFDSGKCGQKEKAKVLFSYVDGGVRFYNIETIKDEHRGVFDELHVAKV